MQIFVNHQGLKMGQIELQYYLIYQLFLDFEMLLNNIFQAD